MTSPDHFARLGLPRRFSLDSAEIEARYLARSREVHPDFHLLRSEADQRASLEASAGVNEAYAVLRDPFRRADYLVTLEGGPSSAESREMAPSFLEEMLDLRMRIEEEREAGATAANLPRLEAELDARRRGLLDQVGGALTAFESSGDRAKLTQARQLLNAYKYVQGLLNDLRAD